MARFHESAFDEAASDKAGARAVLRASPLRRVDLEVGAAAALAVWFVVGDVRLASMSGLLVCAYATLRRIDRWLPFSFGEGFVGYRSDPGWPRGVQEDDDARWNWKPHAGRQFRDRYPSHDS